MQRKIEIIKENTRNMHLLIVDTQNDGISSAEESLGDFFGTTSYKSGLKESYIFFRTQTQKPVDLILIHFNALESGVVEFVRKVREKDPAMQIIVTSSLESCKPLEELLLYGMAAIMKTPYREEELLMVFERVVSQISEKKLLDFYLNQLEIMAKESVARKNEIRKLTKTQESRTPKLALQEKETPKEESKISLVEKYQIRSSVGEMENVDVNELDVFGSEKIQQFRDEIAEYEAALCNVDHKNTGALRGVLHEVLEALRVLVRTINTLGVFPVAQNAAANLIEFVDTLSDAQLQDEDKRELFIDILIAMLADFDTWINLVFIRQNAQNIHYFDASFANTCLELEMIFKEESVKASDEDTLEFF